MRKLLQTHLGHRAVFIMGHILQDKYILHCYITLTVVSCCYDQVYEIFNKSCLREILQVRGSDGVSTFRMVRLRTHSLTYHVLSNVVFHYLPCGFGLPECPSPMVGPP